jgi:hypothetical protein
VKNIHWTLQRVKDLYPERGIAFVLRSGNLGGSAYEPGEQLFSEARITLAFWTWALTVSWRTK